jgi:hypothetical protein
LEKPLEKSRAKLYWVSRAKLYWVTAKCGSHVAPLLIGLVDAIFIRGFFALALVTYLVLQHYRRSDIVYLSDPHHGVTSRYLVERGALQFDRRILRCGLAGGRYTPRTSGTDESLKLVWRTASGSTVETRGLYHTEHLRELSRRNLVLAPQLFVDFYLTLLLAFIKRYEYRRYTGKSLWPPAAHALPEPAGGTLGAGIVEEFLTSCKRVVLNPGESVRGAVLYKVFVEWCEDNGLRPLTLREFYSVLRVDPRFELYRREGGTWLKGIGLHRGYPPG